MDRLTLIPGDQDVALPEQKKQDASESKSAAIDTGLLALVLLARFHGIATEPEQLAYEFQIGHQPLDESSILLAARKLQLHARAITSSVTRLDKLPLPALAQMQDGRYLILARLEASADGGVGRVLVQSPEVGRPELLSLDEFSTQWSGRLILLTSRATLSGELRKFDFSWFIPAVIK